MMMPEIATRTASQAMAAVEAEIEALASGGDAYDHGAAVATVEKLLALGERVLEIWIETRGQTPTEERREGFRLLALHRQGAKGDPSFNACRETARELAYHYNLIIAEPDHPEIQQRLALAAMLARHLCLFVGGKIEVAGLGEFCCSSRPLRAEGG
ncbi:MAG TPA: hypothetical protein PK264_03885 [Hyphomicrobiaceae bacterium]|nr:hypothetical protein [Hyphomicrobiaceae bacterium]